MITILANQFKGTGYAMFVEDGDNRIADAGADWKRALRIVGKGRVVINFYYATDGDGNPKEGARSIEGTLRMDGAEKVYLDGRGETWELLPVDSGFKHLVRNPDESHKAPPWIDAEV